MGEKISRITAAAFAVLLALGYFFLPSENVGRETNNSGMKKLELTAGEIHSWEWSPETEKADQVEFRLSGMKRAQGVTVYAEARDGAGNLIASAVQPVAELGDGDSIRLEAEFEKKTGYTLSLWAEGEGTIKTKGEENPETGEFYPMLNVVSRETVYNPVLLYFAAGALLAALTPVTGTGKRTALRRERKGFSLESALPWAVFILLVGLGTFINAMKPYFSFGDIWSGHDEEIHLMKIRNMDPGYVGGIRLLLAGMITWNPGYVPLALGRNLALLFKAGDALAYHVAAGFSTLAYAAMAALAVKHAPRYKATFAAVSMLPAMLFLMTSMTYDTVVTGSLLLGIALALESADREEPVTGLRAVTLVSLLAFGTVAKPAYSLGLLSLMMIPKERFCGKGRAWAFRIFVLIMLCWCMAAMLMPGAYDQVRSGDERFADTDAARQMEYLLAHPIEGGLKPVLLVWNWQDYLTVPSISLWGYLGNNDTVNLIYLLLMLVMAPLCTAGESWEKKSPLTPGRRLTLLGIAEGALILLAFAQYLASSPVGGDVVGMQPRYFTPVWAAAVLALMWPQGIRKALGKAGSWLTAFLFLGCAGVDIAYTLFRLTASGLI